MAPATSKVQPNGQKYSPHTVNKILAILRQITAEASDEFDIADPCRRVSDVSMRGHRTYTREAPNALKPADMPRFLDEVRTRWPEHYACCMLGFTTSLRPSSLRPLRRRGPNADVVWGTSELLVRRSHTEGDEVMDATKTDRDQVIQLDARQIEALRWHCDRLDAANARRAKRNPAAADAMAASDLLFPAPPRRPSTTRAAGSSRAPRSRACSPTSTRCSGSATRSRRAACAARFRTCAARRRSRTS